MGGPGEIMADGRPVQAAVDGGHYILRSEIKHRGVKRRRNQRRRPWITILALIDLGIECNGRPWSNVLAEAGPFVEAGDGTIRSTQVNDVGIVRIDHQISTLTATGKKPVARRNQTVVRAA